MAEKPTLSIQELSYYKLLKALREQDFQESHAGIIANLARFLGSEALLRYILKHPPWYANWDVKAALLQNSATPPRSRAMLSRSFAVLELMQEMDVPGLTAEEKSELKEDIRALTGGIAEPDRTQLKGHLKDRAIKTEGTKTAPAPPSAPLDMPPVDILPMPPGIMMDDEVPDIGEEPEPEDDSLAVEALLAGLALEDQIDVASSTDDEPALKFLLASTEVKVVLAAFENPAFQVQWLPQVLPSVVVPALITSILASEEAYGDASVRVALQAHAALGADVRATIVRAEKARALMETMVAGGIPAFRQHAQDLSGLLKGLPERDRVWLKVFADKRSPLLARSLATILKPAKAAPAAPAAPTATPAAPVVPATPTAPAAPAAPAAPPEPMELSAEDLGMAVMDEPDDMGMSEMEAPMEDDPVSPVAELAPESSMDFSSVLNAQFADLEAISGMPLDKKLQMVKQVVDRDCLEVLLEDENDEVFHSVLSSPGLTEALLARAVPRMRPNRVEMLTKHSTVWRWYRVRWEVLHHPQAPTEAQMEVVGSFNRVPELLHILEDAKIDSVNVKSLAARKIVELFRPLPTEGKVKMIKQSDGKVLSVLWNEAFQDDALMIALVQDRFLHRDVILKICRSPMASRKILYEIAQKSEWSGYPQIKFSLLQNPKTPQSVVGKLLPTLNLLDRQRIIKFRASARQV